MQAQIGFWGDFPAVARQALRPGGWYIGFRCSGCGQHFAVMDDPTDSGVLDLSGDAHFHAVCPNCVDGRDYSVSDLVVFEAAQGGPTSTA